MDIQLFLAHADDHEPMLREGIPFERAVEAPSVEVGGSTRQKVANIEGLANDLVAQKWALVAPVGPVGDRLLSLVEPLRKKRSEEQGREVFVYRVEPGMDAVAVARWMLGEYRDAWGRVEMYRPRYLALLGGPELISWQFQQMLAEEAFVGRIAFDLDAQYEAYVDKLVRGFAVPEQPSARMLWHSVRDGSRATEEGHKHLMEPLAGWANAAFASGAFDAERLVDVPMTSSSGSALDSTSAAGALLQEASAARAGLLFTMSHGAGVPKEGWKSAEEQRGFQGAMVLGRKGDLLTANDLTKATFLPGGVWFMFACYGAGTPSESAYLPWLERLCTLGFLSKSATNVLGALPKVGERPFVAALPQAALANPAGPIGFIGHVDLAWSWSFLEYEVSARGFALKNRAERFQSVLQALVHGHRLGVAHREWMKFVGTVNAEITALDELIMQRAAETSAGVDTRTLQIARANAWMRRQDVAAYVLLGDPAARLPITRFPPGVGRVTTNESTMFSTAVEDQIDAVMTILRGTASTASTAKRMRVSRREVESWVEVFVAGGRLALAKRGNG